MGNDPSRAVLALLCFGLFLCHPGLWIGLVCVCVLYVLCIMYYSCYPCKRLFETKVQEHNFTTAWEQHASLYMYYVLCIIHVIMYMYYPCHPSLHIILGHDLEIINKVQVDHTTGNNELMIYEQN